MSAIGSHNARIAKNSVFLSIRMVVVLFITLYTTRVLLDALGVIDYGIYNVVCGFVAMFSFLNTSISNGIQRFYNFELGKNGAEGAGRVYNTSLIIQTLLALILLVLLEAVGPWYIDNKMVLPPERLPQANLVFQFAVASFVLTVLQAPFTAAVMAHEKMDFYAVISVLDAVLKLAVVIVISKTSSDRLALYGGLIFLVSVIHFLAYVIYARKSFSELRLNLKYMPELFRSMLTFSGWNIFGTLSTMFKDQGINIIMNLFFGPVVNAARGVSAQVNSGIQSFVSSLTIPVRPQVIQSFARGDFRRTLDLTYSVSKFGCFLMYLMALPISYEIDFILNIWLGGVVPEHTGSFVILVILNSFIGNLNSPVSGIVHASGKMKLYQLSTSAVSLMSVPLGYLFLKLGAEPEIALLTVFILSAVSQVVSLFVLKTVISFSIRDYLKAVMLPLLVVFAATVWVPVPLIQFMEQGWLRLVTVTVVSIAVTLPLIYYIGLNATEKRLMIDLVKKFFRRNEN